MIIIAIWIVIMDLKTIIADEEDLWCGPVSFAIGLHLDDPWKIDVNVGIALV